MEYLENWYGDGDSSYSISSSSLISFLRIEIEALPTMANWKLKSRVHRTPTSIGKRGKGGCIVIKPSLIHCVEEN